MPALTRAVRARAVTLTTPDGTSSSSSGRAGRPSASITRAAPGMRSSSATHRPSVARATPRVSSSRQPRSSRRGARANGGSVLAVQCKRYRRGRHVHSREIQLFNGSCVSQAYEHKVYVASGGFGTHASDAARRFQVHLIDERLLSAWLGWEDR